jgi:hypothetical protein
MTSDECPLYPRKQTFVGDVDHVACHIGKGRSLSDDTPATTFNAIEP